MKSQKFLFTTKVDKSALGGGSSTSGIISVPKNFVEAVFVSVGDDYNEQCKILEDKKKQYKKQIKVVIGNNTEEYNMSLAIIKGSLQVQLQYNKKETEILQRYFTLSYSKIVKGASTSDEDKEYINIYADSNNRLRFVCKPITNVLFYGVPGVGKSSLIQNNYLDSKSNYQRVVFHPDYTYGDFVGQILPQKVGDDIKYDFMPGPFTKILTDAHNKKNEHFFLIIEEINRGNAAAIFGDVFQLLDRENNGESNFGIVNRYIAREIYHQKIEKIEQNATDENKKEKIEKIEKTPIKIPANLTILATMNTSDQNVFTIDTAFQRRWCMVLVENDMDDWDDEVANSCIGASTVKWKKFAKCINSQILKENFSALSSEDKRLGKYFLTPEEITNSKRFANKVIKYLWDDAFKFSRSSVFEDANGKSLEDIIKAFTSQSTSQSDKKKCFNIFVKEIRDQL